MICRHAIRGLIVAVLLSVFALGVSVPQPASAAEPAGFAYFHTYAENEALIDSLVAAHPGVAQKFSIGKSYESRQIWAIKLTSNVSGSTKGKPEVMINALMHARERASNELALYMMQVLANNYGRGGKLGNKVTDILDTTVVYIIPMMNPDGAEYDFSGGRFHKWRKNRQPIPGSSYVGIDLNRQFSYTWACCGGSSANPKSDTYRGPSAFYTPEDQAYRDFVNSRVTSNGTSKITEILSLHSAAKEVLWPYSYTKQDVPSDMTADDHATFVALGKGMANKNGYRPMQGSDLYIVDGDQDDWAYAVHGIFALTIELPKGAQKRYYPTQSEISTFNKQNLNAVLWDLKQAGCPYAAAGLAASHCGASSGQQFYSQSVLDANAVQPQQTNCWCAVASTRALLEHLNQSFSLTQPDIDAFMAEHDKSDWHDPDFSGYLRCSRGSPSPSFAHDTRGMAWALWNWSTPDQSVGYNDYAGSRQANMDWQIVRGIRATGQPVSAIVVHGHHAILVTGYQTALDPLDEEGQPNTILGMRVWDPWYGAGFGSWPGWPSNGFAPNSFVTIADWNKKYFTTDQNEGPYYAGAYVAVLRSSVAEAPSDAPAQSYGEWAYANVGSGTPSGSSLDGAPASASASTIAQAVTEGLSTYGLLGDPTLGNLPTDYTLGTSVHVNSLSADMPSYDLVELRSGDSVKAVALVNERSGRYVFGELRATTGDVRLPTQVQLASVLRTNGLGGTPSLSWTWTDAATPPFAPFLTGTDATGRTAFVTPAGVVQRVDTVSAGTPDSN